MAIRARNLAIKSFMIPAMAALLIASVLAQSTPSNFKNVKFRTLENPNKAKIVERAVDLTFDDAAGNLTIVGSGINLVVPYGDIEKAVAESTHHMKGLGFETVLAAGPIGATAIANQSVSSNYLYIKRKGKTEPEFLVLAVDKDSVSQCFQKALQTFGDRMQVPEFPKAEAIEAATFPHDKSKYEISLDRSSRNPPSIHDDESLIVVVAPMGWEAERARGNGGPFKLYANNEVVAVNAVGSYSYTYLSPGNYLLASQSGNSSHITGIRLNLEAGKDYYFLQDLTGGWTRLEIGLSMHSKELVLSELRGTFLSYWRKRR
jgi:hypothetical protein